MKTRKGHPNETNTGLKEQGILNSGSNSETTVFEAFLESSKSSTQEAMLEKILDEGMWKSSCVEYLEHLYPLNAIPFLFMTLFTIID